MTIVYKCDHCGAEIDQSKWQHSFIPEEDPKELLDEALQHNKDGKYRPNISVSIGYPLFERLLLCKQCANEWREYVIKFFNLTDKPWQEELIAALKKQVEWKEMQAAAREELAEKQSRKVREGVGSWLQKQLTRE